MGVSINVGCFSLPILSNQKEREKNMSATFRDLLSSDTYYDPFNDVHSGPISDAEVADLFSSVSIDPFAIYDGDGPFFLHRSRDDR